MRQYLKIEKMVNIHSLLFPFTPEYMRPIGDKYYLSKLFNIYIPWKYLTQETNETIW